MILFTFVVISFCVETLTSIHDQQAPACAPLWHSHLRGLPGALEDHRGEQEKNVCLGSRDYGADPLATLTLVSPSWQSYTILIIFTPLRTRFCPAPLPANAALSFYTN